MKRIEKYKNIIMIVFICYVVLFSFLLIKQSNKINEKLESKIVSANQYQGLVLFDKFINDKKSDLAKYKKINNKQVNAKCLERISSIVENSYVTNHGINTYEDLFSLYSDISETPDFVGLAEECSFNDNELEKIRYYYIKKISLIEDDFNKILDLYQVKIEDQELTNYIKDSNFLDELYDVDILGTLRKIDMDYLEKLFQILGERYE